MSEATRRLVQIEAELKTVHTAAHRARCALIGLIGFTLEPDTLAALASSDKATRIEALWRELADAAARTRKLLDERGELRSTLA